MAKKSAKSKGFRKQNVKKPYLSKRDIVLLCLLLVAVGIGAFFLFRYDDGALKVKDGVVVAETENDLIVNGSSVRGRARYYKLGEIGEVEGLDREKQFAATDPNVPQFVFTTPEGADAGIRVNAVCSHSKAHVLADGSHAMIANITGVTDISALKTVELGGRSAEYYAYTSSAAEAEQPATEAEAEQPATEDATEAEATDATDAEATDAAQFERSAVAYLDASHDSCVVLRAEANAETAEALPAEEALLAELERVAGTITLLEG
ncbi:MAG: hypothetical protein IKN05_01380 [Clostridia bacterium]|nr:hypothetical protein [Clostridia bacterium]